MAGKTLTPRQGWVEAGLHALASGGPDAVRVETLARTLGVTKGGFYGHFGNREALLEEMLDTWEHEAVDTVLATVESQGDPQDRARQAGDLTFSPDRLLPIDLAVRDWARRDAAVAERLRRVDNHRMELLRETIGTVCEDPEEVEARSLLAFCAAIGAHYLAADHGDQTREQVLAHATNLLFGR